MAGSLDRGELMAGAAPLLIEEGALKGHAIKNEWKEFRIALPKVKAKHTGKRDQVKRALGLERIVQGDRTPLCGRELCRVDGDPPILGLVCLEIWKIQLSCPFPL